MLREFQSLRRLLCVHGTRDLSRSWTITGYSLYKSVVLCGCQTMYSLFTLFSGASLFCSLHLTFYSIVLFVFFFFNFSSFSDSHRRTHHQTRPFRRGTPPQSAALRLLQRRRPRPLPGLLGREFHRHPGAGAGAGRDHRERVHLLRGRVGERFPDARDVLRGVLAAGPHDDSDPAELFVPTLLRDRPFPRRHRVLHRSARFLALQRARRLYVAPVFGVFLW